MSMLERATKYAKLYNHGRGKSAADIAERFCENEVTVYKLIRMGNAPDAVHALIRKKRVPATVVLNLLKSSMTDKQMIEAVSAETQRREAALAQLEKEGFHGGTSMTLRRAITLAVANLKKRRLIKSDKQKAIAEALSDIFGGDKPTVADIEKAILTS